MTPVEMGHPGRKGRGVVQPGGLGLQVPRGPDRGLALGGAELAWWRRRRVGRRRPAGRGRPGWRRRGPATHGPASELASGKKHQAASHRYSVTWMTSIRMVMVMPRAAASARIHLIWSLFPSASAIQVRSRRGSRRSAPAKTAATTSAASAAMLAVSHLPAACGPAGGAGARIAAAVRGTGVMPKTAPISAIRLRLRTSPRDSRPSCSARSCGPCGQSPGAAAGQHHDALAVAGQGQHVTGTAPGGGRCSSLA